MYSLIKRFFFKDAKIRTFAIARLKGSEIREKVYLQNDSHVTDITTKHGMICLEPFCIAVWLSKDEAKLCDDGKSIVAFIKGKKTVASVVVSLLERVEEGQSILLLYKIASVTNYQFTFIHRFVLFAYLLRNKTSTYLYRRTISALYSYPRKIIIVSYGDEHYCNIFPMDIQGYIQEGNMYVLGLRTTNVTLEKILAAKKVVICDTYAVDINTIYTLGKHPSASPPKREEFPFGIVNSELFNFPVPDFAGSYKEIEIVMHKKMGYHMLMVGKVVNQKIVKQDASSFYHVSVLEYLKADYSNIEAVY